MAAHVGLPGIGAGLAPTAGVFLATERSADLGAAGADVDVGDPAIRAVDTEEALSRPNTIRENRGTETLAHSIVQRDRIIQLVELIYIKDRRERLISSDQGISPGGDAHDCRLDEMTGFVRESFDAGDTTAKNLAPLTRSAKQRCVHFIHCTLIDQRPHQRLRVERVANGDLLVCPDETIGERINDLAMANQSASRRATLPGRPHRAEQHAADGQVHIRIRHDDNRVVAPQL